MCRVCFGILSSICAPATSFFSSNIAVLKDHEARDYLNLAATILSLNGMKSLIAFILVNIALRPFVDTECVMCVSFLR